MKLLLATLFVASATAATIPVASQGTLADGGEMNSRGWTLAITPHPAWSPALPGSSWVSYGNTGDPTPAGYFVVPNDSTTAFWQALQLGPGEWSGIITFMADDTASFAINNHLLIPEAIRSGNHYTTCSDYPPGCLVATAYTVVIPTGLLHEGSNVLTWVAAQRDGSSFGLDYAGFVTDGVSRDVATPEPGTWWLVIAGCALISGRRVMGC